ncbi:MAG: helix-turn-helix transcriptional regulator [Eubacteriales bacterium]|nr:helix-turn-helix transcriptional regulator [Eubacteriales bacterium]
MKQNKSLSTQEVADILHISKSTVYELIRRGEINSYKIGRKVRFTQEDVDAYISRSRHENSVKPVKQMNIASTLLNAENETRPDIIISGQDVVLDILANHLPEYGFSAGRSYLSSFEGLLALYEGKVDAASCHLFSADYGQFNTPFVRTLLPGVPTVLINISYRRQGFYVRKGNPKKIRDWNDLKRADITILNRRLGSSSRILLDGMLKKMNVSAENIKGYDNIMRSHLTMAAAIAEGEADLGLGTERVSRQLEGIEFVPLIEERYDLVVKSSFLKEPVMRALPELFRSPSFRKEISCFSGNNYRDMGRIITED